MLEKNQKVKIYIDYQKEKDYEGEAILVDFKRKGQSFILEKDEELPVSKMQKYSYELWLVEFIESDFYELGFKTLRKIRYKL